MNPEPDLRGRWREAAGALAADPDRLAQGWEPRFVADEARAQEMARLYRELGYETAVDSVGVRAVRSDCGECPLVTLGLLKLIYTRAPGSTHGA